ncbi:MAG: hypothetical protein RLZ25_2353 [Pseudomonadota bacterium]
MRNNQLDHRDDGQDEKNGKDDTAHNVGSRGAPCKVSDTILGTLHTESSGNHATYDVQKSGFFLGRHELTGFLCA